MSGKLKVSIRALSLGLVTLLSTGAFSQTATPARTPAIIGIVNIQDAIIATNEGKKEFDALQARFAPKRDSLKTLADEIESMKKDIQAKGGKLNDEERANQAKALAEKQKILQRNYDDAQAEFQQAEQEVVKRIGGKMLNVLEKYAKNNGYTVILDVSNPQSDVLWASQGTNITKELVDAYNAEPPANAAPAPSSSGAATPKPNL
jgi:outer membrane protein